MHYVPESSIGEKCSCGKPASHKVEEVLDYGVFESIEDMISAGVRHPLTMYLCCSCFSALMGPTASEWCGLTPRALDGATCPCCHSSNVFTAVICIACGAHTVPRQ